MPWEELPLDLVRDIERCFCTRRPAPAPKEDGYRPDPDSRAPAGVHNLEHLPVIWALAVCRRMMDWIDGWDGGLRFGGINELHRQTFDVYPEEWRKNQQNAFGMTCDDIRAAMQVDAPVLNTYNRR